MVGPLGVDEWVAQNLVARLPRGSHHAEAGYGWIARVGEPSVFGVMTTVALGWALRRRDLPGGLFAVVGPGFAFVLAEIVIKHLVARRIHAEDFMFVFPSAAIVFSPVLLAVCIAVVALGWHYATDVIGGLALGGAVVLAVAGILAAFERRITANGLTTAGTRL